MKPTSPFLHFFSLCPRVPASMQFILGCQLQSTFLAQASCHHHPLPNQTGLSLPQMITPHPLLPHSFLPSRPLPETFDSFPKPKPSRPGSSPRDLDDLKTTPLSTALNSLPQPHLILWVHTMAKSCHSHRVEIGTKSKDGSSHVPWGQAH